jgi:tetratricopeptide (TPR) repeat protein
MTSAYDEKELGSAAWKSGNYEGAIEHFSKAINFSDQNDKESLKILYSNRSAAYMKVNQFSSALIDGEKCVELDSSWAKGYSRKGDALLSLRRYTPAYNSYNAALRITPNDSTLLEKSEQAMRGIREAAGTNTSTSVGSESANSPTRIDSIKGYIGIFMVANAILYFIPFLGHSFSSGCYRRFLFASIANIVIGLYKAFGIPKFNMSYLQQLLSYPHTMYVHTA